MKKLRLKSSLYKEPSTLKIRVGWEEVPMPSVHNAILKLGDLVVTQLASSLLQNTHRKVGEFLDRHCSGDWGDLSEQDKNTNNLNLMVGNSVLSMYLVGGEQLFVLTNSKENQTIVFRKGDFTDGNEGFRS
jgi:hypothetical protein